MHKKLQNITSRCKLTYFNISIQDHHLPLPPRWRQEPQQTPDCALHLRPSKQPVPIRRPGPLFSLFKPLLHPDHHRRRGILPNQRPHTGPRPPPRQICPRMSILIPLQVPTWRPGLLAAASGRSRCCVLRLVGDLRSGFGVWYVHPAGVWRIESTSGKVRELEFIAEL